jgi:hypothetical protein
MPEKGSCSMQGHVSSKKLQLTDAAMFIMIRLLSIFASSAQTLWLCGFVALEQRFAS